MSTVRSHVGRPGRRREAWLRRRLVTERASVPELAAAAGVRASTIYRWLGRTTIPRRRWPASSVSPQSVAAQYNAGSNPHQIALRTGMSRSTVVTRLAQAGVLEAPTDPRAWIAATHYQGGRSLESVADELQVTRRKVTLWLLTLRVTIRRGARAGHGPRSRQDRRTDGGPRSSGSRAAHAPAAGPDAANRTVPTTGRNHD
jgi:transposase